VLVRDRSAQSGDYLSEAMRSLIPEGHFIYGGAGKKNFPSPIERDLDDTEVSKRGGPSPDRFS
jgi:hypothetical protein